MEYNYKIKNINSYYNKLKLLFNIVNKINIM